MQETADFLALVRAQAAFFEAADAYHQAVQVGLLVLGQPGIDRRVLVPAGFDGLVFLFLSGGGRFFAHGK